MSNAVEQRKLCQQCGTRVAVLKVDNRIVCLDCQNERPIIPLKKWDEVVTPTYILALERQITALGERVTVLESIIHNMEADS
jgi:hypothetical protein